MPTVSRRAYAKVNLMLSVGPAFGAQATSPGFHPIASWMAPITLWDDVEVTPLPGGASEHVVEWAADAPRPTPIDWAIEKDLAALAHRAMERLAGRDLPARVVVRKRIPVGGGLGGGSSDAAACMLAVSEAFGVAIDDAARGAAAALGSDVAFFLDEARGGDQPPRAAVVTGLGEAIERVPTVGGDLVVVIPPVGCATGAVYKAFDAILVEREAERRAAWEGEALAREARGVHRGRPPTAHAVRPELVRERMRRMKGELDGALLFNDLAHAAFRVEPRLREWALALSRATRREVHVTGSGSCLFIVTDRPDKTLSQSRGVMNPVGGVVVGVSVACGG